MPLSNRRNSRDDKSNKKGRPSTNSTSGGYKPKGRDTEAPNRHQSGRGFSRHKANGQSSESGRDYGSNDRSKPYSRGAADERPFSRENSRDSRKPYSRDAQSGRRDNRKPYSADSDSRPGRPYKRPYNKQQAEPGQSGYNSRNRSGSARAFRQEPANDGLIRLNRYVANAGICSRRKADELIEAGVIRVNGEVVTALGTKVDPAKDDIRYNGERLQREKMVYVLLNKPKDYITTTDDPQERRTVMQLVAKATRERIYPVGRLDRNTTGLLLLTNDGNLSEKLSHPRNNVSKIYNIELSKNLTQGDLNKISFGIELEDGFIKPDAISYVQGGSKREVGIQIHSGKNRIVRRIFEHLGYDVIKLDRVVYANLTKKDLPRGRWRYLEEKEIIQLKHFIK